MARTLILVKHSLPVLEPDVPSREWRLGDVGRARCLPLAEQLAAYRPAFIGASAEPKATETARIVADLLSIPVSVWVGIHENDRTALGWLGRDELEVRIARFFAEPDTLVMGNETANQTHARFSAAVQEVCDEHPADTIVIVAHGTVITLFISRLVGVEPFPLWQRLGLPSFIALSLPENTIQTVVGRIEET